MSKKVDVTRSPWLIKKGYRNAYTIELFDAGVVINRGDSEAGLRLSYHSYGEYELSDNIGDALLERVNEGERLNALIDDGLSIRLRRTMNDFLDDWDSKDTKVLGIQAKITMAGLVDVIVRAQYPAQEGVHVYDIEMTYHGAFNVVWEDEV